MTQKVLFVEGNAIDALLNCEIDVLAHCANCQNTFGSGIAKEIRERLPKAYKADCDAVALDINRLGNCSLCSDGKVVNLYGQDLFGRDRRQVNYGAFASALRRMKYFLLDDDVVGFPYRVASDRAGGDWEVIKELILWELKDHTVRFYYLPGTELTTEEKQNAVV
jgi:O-acetyl-ADP-ribose deacetylase (regulator of RNase III)